MKYIFLSIFLFASMISAQVMGLNGWDIYLDPGHSGTENMGVYGYSEAERNLRVGLRLREMLLSETDIDTVWNSRYNDSQQMSLSQRTDQANALGASWFHSIHSDAGASSSNSTLLLHGGWRKDGQTVEKIPGGGKEMADNMIDLLTRGMRIETRGNYADRTFYQGFPQNHTNQYPYLHVNRESSMPSELSESGFHTNPVQNQLFMNADWKRLEARTFFWSILKYHQVPRPLVRILTGIVRDEETSIPINGAEISLEDRTYVTDTYESLFYRFTNDPDLLHNGFYYFENIETAESEVIVDADGYYPDTLHVTMVDTFFTFLDVDLVSKALPEVLSTVPANGDTGYSVIDNIIIRFNRPMNPDSVAANITIDPEIDGRIFWSDLNREMKINPNILDFKTVYTITLNGNLKDNYGHPLDGNGDGTGGDDYVLQFKTGFDAVPPELFVTYPAISANSVEVRPIISLEFDEELNDSSVTGQIMTLERLKNGAFVSGAQKHYVVKDRSVINFFPDTKLFGNEIYVSHLDKGLEDLLGNAMTGTTSYSFTTGANDFQITQIDAFESGFTSNWWNPDQSGTKAGYDPATMRRENNEYTNLLSGSNASMEIFYDWDPGANSWILREYLGGGSPRSVVFSKENILQIYIFGDGGGNQFRFAIDEGSSSSNFTSHEVSKWHTINWIGWRLVQWDLSDPNSVGNWIGNGKLDGSTYRFDSIQLTHVPGADETGSLFFDDLRLAKKVSATALSPENSKIPETYYLSQNFPNPFNPQTEIHFGLPQDSEINIHIYNMAGQKVASIFEGVKGAGMHKIKFDASGLSSGIYVYRLSGPGVDLTKRMVLIK